jgi:hypothetical protein
MILSHRTGKIDEQAAAMPVMIAMGNPMAPRESRC